MTAVAESSSVQSSSVADRACWSPWAALAVAGAGLGGSLALTWGLNLKACPLCFYQRTFVMSLTALLGIGLLVALATPGRLSLLSLPLAAAGLGVALFHVRLELTGKLECPPGLLGLGSAPQQSAAMFSVLTLLLLIGALGAGLPMGQKLLGLAAGVGVGGLLALAASTSNPPMPPAPAAPYPNSPDICRPPYQPPTSSASSAE